jgi:hypothetical protein
LLTKLIAGSALVIAAVGVASASDLHQATGPAQAQPICAFVSAEGTVDLAPVGTCIPYPFGVNCQTLELTLPAQVVTVDECAPH